MFVKVYIKSSNKVSSVYSEEALFLISKGLACYPEDMEETEPAMEKEKAIQPTYENKMIEKPKTNKGRKANGQKSSK